MSYPIDEKLVIAIASSALFDLAESDAIFRQQGEEIYRQYQREHQNDPLNPGVAFPFIKRLLALNSPGDAPIEIILMSRNDPDTGARVLSSIRHHGLNISRAVFTSGVRPYEYIPAYGAKVFLTANEEDAMKAINEGWPAGLVLDCKFVDDPCDSELRVAFDFDGVVADDESERLYAESSLEEYLETENARAEVPLNPGPLKPLLEGIAKIQERERKKREQDPEYQPRVRVAIVTARSAPAEQRIVSSLRSWGIIVDTAFYLGGIEKRRVLEVFRPHIFFDDQRIHLDLTADQLPSVHVPFGVRNESP